MPQGPAKPKKPGPGLLKLPGGQTVPYQKGWGVPRPPGTKRGSTPGSRAKELRKALESGRAEARPGAPRLKETHVVERADTTYDLAGIPAKNRPKRFTIATGPPLRGPGESDITYPGGKPRVTPRTKAESKERSELAAANVAIEKSLRRSKGRRAAGEAIARRAKRLREPVRGAPPRVIARKRGGTRSGGGR